MRDTTSILIGSFMWIAVLTPATTSATRLNASCQKVTTWITTVSAKVPCGSRCFEHANSIRDATANFHPYARNHA